MAFKLSFGKKMLAADDMVSDTTIMEAPAAAPARGKTKAPAAKRPVAEQIKTLGVIFAALFAATAGLVIYQGRQSAHATTYVAAAGEMQMLSQQIAKSAQLALQGSAPAFAELKTGSARFSSLLQALAEGGEIDGVGVPAVPSSSRPQLDALAET